MKTRSVSTPSAPEPRWIETEGTVTTCSYQFTGLSNLAFGFSRREKFRIAFDYYAHGRLYSDEFESPVAIAQNERIAIAYNPLRPEQNSRTSGQRARAVRSPLIAVGILGSAVLSLLWLIILRGCS